MVVVGITYGDVDSSVWHILHDTGKEFLEWSAKEDAKQCIFNNMGMDFEGCLANLHVEVLCTAESLQLFALFVLSISK